MFSDLRTRIQQFAREAGFELCGIAPVRDFGELQVFPSWIADGRHGEMKYMEARNEAAELKRAKLANVAPWARSVIVCAVNYNTAPPYSTQTEDRAQGWISRYAWSREDYHEAVLRQLRVVESKLRELFDSADTRQLATGSSLQTCAYVDTGPLIERVYAKYAGIGWIGKNTCIINQKLGSWLFLGVILTSLEATAELAADLPAPDRCGTCTRCIAACPTQAIVAPGELDARLCISYLTIEKRGEIPEDLRSGMGRHVFGCDICQDVCPWNRKAPVTTADEFQPREGLVNPRLDWLAEMPPEEFRSVFRGSPVRRAKLSGLRRNAVIAMGNSGDQKFAPTLKKLAENTDPVIAEHAKWALDHLKQVW
jgi:epoxyqueuosine reductase